MSRVESLQGLHDIGHDDYHSDVLTPEVSLSSSGIRTLLTQTPAHFKAKNRRISDWPDRLPLPTKEMDLGTAVHALLLGKGIEIEVCNFDDWRTTAAKNQRDLARSQNRLPMLHKVYTDATEIAVKAAQALHERFGGWPIGESEQAAIWQRSTRTHRPIWCRAMLDHFSFRAATILDLKTTSRPIGDDDLQRKIAGDGLDIQAAFYIDGIAAIFPELAGLTQFMFVFIETEPPFGVRFVKITESWLTRARFRIDRAADIFAECLKSDEWPGWVEETSLSAPQYLEAKWETQELEEAV